MTVSEAFNVLLLGAGQVNFGTSEGPWCHTTRLERKLGDRLNIVGLVDPDLMRADEQLGIKRKASVPGYAATKAFSNIAAAAEVLTGESSPALVIFGIPPCSRGSCLPNRDAELQVQRYFPSASLFLEKPITDSTVEDVRGVSAALRDGGARTSVGYMLRYLDATKRMKDIITYNKLTVTATIATYLMAYEFAGTNDRVAYFDLRQEPGPIVSQATHIVDLCRYLAGSPADLDSVLAHTLSVSEAPGKLSRCTFESTIPDEHSIPRITDAIWKWESGATATLVHGVSLHDGGYDVEIVVLADGWKLKLVDPYGTPKLYVRRPGIEVEEETIYTADDPFYSELSTFIDVIEGTTDEGEILCSYDDAIATYQLTCAIREAGEMSAAKRKAKTGN